MLPLVFQTPVEIAREVAGRVRSMRISREWTQKELASRSGVALGTLRRFEQTGKVSFEDLLLVAVALSATEEFGRLFPQPTARTLAELERQSSPPRQRAKRRISTSHDFR